MKKTRKRVVATEDSMGKRLKAWRKSQPLTLIELGKIIGVSQGSLSELENDKSLPSAGTLRNLCVNADIDIYWLLTGEGNLTRNITQSADQLGLPGEFKLAQKDHKLRDLIKCLIRIYKKGGAEKNAHLFGYLYGADPG